MLEQIHSSYPWFKESFEIELKNKKGIPIDQVRFGNALGHFDTASCTIIPRENGLISQIIRGGGFIQKLSDSGYQRIGIIANNGEQWNNSSLKLVDKSEMPERLAVSKLIITEQLLPKYFAKHDDQRVVLLVYGDEEWLQADRIERANGIISSLLNVSTIVLHNDVDKNWFVKKMQLSGVYEGNVFQLQSNTTLDETEVELLSDKQETIGCFNKQKVLLFANWIEDQYAKVLLNSLCQQFNPDTMDITLMLNRRVEEKWLIRLLDEVIPDNVRLMFRAGGKLTASLEDNINTEFLMRRMRNTEMIESLLDMLDQKVLYRDYQRMLGNNQFDTFIYLGTFNRLWTALTKVIPASRKRHIVLEYTAYRYSKQSRLNLTAIQNRLFDDVMCWSNSLLEIEYEPDNARFSKELFPYLPRYNSGFTVDTVEGVFQDKSVAIGEYIEKDYGNYDVRLLPCIDNDKKAYIVSAMTSDYVFIYEQLLKDNEPKTMILVDYVSAFDEDSLTPQDYLDVIKVNMLPMSNMALILEYASSVTAYLTTSSLDASGWSTVCAIKEIPIIFIDGQGAYDVSDCYKDRKSYGEFSKRTVNEILVSCKSDE